MTPLAKIELVTRPLGNYVGAEPDQPPDAEIVVGIRYDGQDLMLPAESQISVEYEAGASIASVRLTLLAGIVRYVPEAGT